LKETRPLWPPQRGVGLREPNLGKTNPRVTLLFACDLFCALSRGLVSLLLTLTRLVVVIIFCKFQFRPIHPPSRRLSHTLGMHIFQGVIFHTLLFLIMLYKSTTR
jgi:hypothetical protein